MAIAPNGGAPTGLPKVLCGPSHGTDDCHCSDSHVPCCLLSAPFGGVRWRGELNDFESSGVGDLSIIRSAVMSETADRHEIRSSTAKVSIADFTKQVLVVDLLVVLAVSLTVWPLTLGDSTPVSLKHVWVPLLSATIWFACLLLAKTIDRRSVLHAEGIKRVVMGTGYYLLVCALTEFLFDSTAAVRPALFATVGFGAPLLALARVGTLSHLKSLRTRGKQVSNVVVVGTPASSREVLDALAAHSQYALKRVVDPTWLTESGTGSLIARRATEGDSEIVIVTNPAELGDGGLRELAWRVEEAGSELLIAPGLPDIAASRISYEPMAGLPLMQLRKPHESSGAQILKRAFDVISATVMLLLLMPLLLTMSVLIKVEDRGPVFFIQPRVGKHGKFFPFIKFRSMRVNAHTERADLLGLADEGILERYRSDDRVTRIGKFIRRWSIDELPQLLNVLSGHMSMVGPRPVLEEELPQLLADGHRRHLTKPGLTGLWQISGRKEVTWDDRIRMDLTYVDCWSFGLDMQILAKTAQAVVKGNGAY